MPSRRRCHEPIRRVTARAAVFLDRDGILIEDRHYLRDPAGVSLIAGTAAAIARLRRAGYAVVVITNQSGIARGRITREEYEAVKARVDVELAAAGTQVDATYMCPHHPAFTGPCACRKPGTSLFTDAARDLGIDLARSYVIGDRWRDVEPSIALGARGILVPGPDTTAEERSRVTDRGAAPDGRVTLATTLTHAVDGILGSPSPSPSLLPAGHLTAPPAPR